jgi:peroxiredoxin
LRSLQASLSEFEKRGVRLVAVSVDPVETNKRHREKIGVTFPILSDEKAEVIKRYDLLHAGGFDGKDIARPAEFLLASDGTILWVNLTENYRVRVRGEELLKVIDGLAGK